MAQHSSLSMLPIEAQLNNLERGAKMHPVRDSPVAQEEKSIQAAAALKRTINEGMCSHFALPLSRIRGVVVNYPASQAREPGINSHKHQQNVMKFKPISPSEKDIVCLAAIFTSG